MDSGGCAVCLFFNNKKGTKYITASRLPLCFAGLRPSGLSWALFTKQVEGFQFVCPYQVIMTLFGITSILNGIEFKLMTGDQEEVTKVSNSYRIHQHHSGINIDRNLMNE